MKLPLTKVQEQAAVLCAADELTDEAIAAQCRISSRTLWYWKAAPQFQERVAYHRQLWRQKVETEGIADRARRVQAANERWRRMRRVIDERAADPTMEDIPGGTTGLLVRTYKAIGTGPTAQMVEEYAVDTGLLKSLLDHEKQTAQDLGQWTEKQEHSGDLIVRRYEGVPVEEV